MAKKIKSILLLTLSMGFILFMPDLMAQNIQPLKDVPFHEAFAEQVTGGVALEAVPTSPPNPIVENIPQQTDSETSWIAGYWEWIKNENDFVWISGIWRRPPPDMQWTPGFWQQFDTGWARVRGFWSNKQAGNNFTYINMTPPDSVDEDAGQSPGSNYFWMPGYWYYQDQQYSWVAGSWQAYDPNWVLVPAHYVWRPEGYVFINLYWDWPMDQRGSVYSPVYIQPDDRENVEYLPTVVINYPVMINQLFTCYPDYLYLFQYDYYYNPDYWLELAPPWWAWQPWWGFSWHNQWGCWWWYCHPGYPQPYWMTSDISRRIAPPSDVIIRMERNTKPPFIVTPNGVVAPNQILNAIKKGDGGRKVVPVLPANPASLERIQQQALPKSPISPGNVLRPSGQRLPPNVRIQPPKPNFRPEGVLPPSRTLPRAPSEIPKKPVIPSKPSLPPSGQLPERPRPVKPLPQKPSRPLPGIPSAPEITPPTQPIQPPSGRLPPQPRPLPQYPSSPDLTPPSDRVPQEPRKPFPQYPGRPQITPPSQQIQPPSSSWPDQYRPLEPMPVQPSKPIPQTPRGPQTIQPSDQLPRYTPSPNRQILPSQPRDLNPGKPYRGDDKKYRSSSDALFPPEGDVVEP